MVKPQGKHNTYVRTHTCTHTHTHTRARARKQSPAAQVRRQNGPDGGATGRVIAHAELLAGDVAPPPDLCARPDAVVGLIWQGMLLNSWQGMLRRLPA